MSQKVVYVIGAGASCDTGLPSGEKLIKDIKQFYDVPANWRSLPPMKNGLTQLFRDVALKLNGDVENCLPYICAARQIMEGMSLAKSIDHYIDQHRENAYISICGKLAIIKIILQYERNSHIRLTEVDNKNWIDFDSVQELWYKPFFGLLTEYCSKSDLAERFKRLALIIFNYDRCIEHFLFYALQHHYSMSPEDAVSIISNIMIYHPYGSVGNLPWSNANDSLHYGCEPSASQLIASIARIKTFTEEQKNKSSEITSIREEIKSAAKLVFLGFGFHKQNIDILIPEYANRSYINRPRIFVTALNTSDNDKAVIKYQISRLFQNSDIRPNFSNNNCFKFFSEYKLSLGFNNLGEG